MSRDVGSISVSFFFQFSLIDWSILIEGFENIGFRLHNGHESTIKHLPEGVTFGDYDWSCTPLSKRDLFLIIEKKINEEEQIGFSVSMLDNPLDDIAITTQKSSSNGTVLVFFLSNVSKVIDDGCLTDFSAYLKLIVPVCYKVGKEFEIECEQYIDRI